MFVKIWKTLFLKVYAKALQGEGRSLVLIVIAAKFVILETAGRLLSGTCKKIMFAFPSEMD